MCIRDSLKTPTGKHLSGNLSALEQGKPSGETLALDPEGIRLIDGKTLAISDEYGPVSYTHLTLPTSDLV